MAIIYFTVLGLVTGVMITARLAMEWQRLGQNRRRLDRRMARHWFDEIAPAEHRTRGVAFGLHNNKCGVLFLHKLISGSN